MKVTKSTLIGINNFLFTVSDLPGVKFAYAISKNKGKLKAEMKALNDMQQQPEDFIEYEKELAKLAKKHARRDEKGNIIQQQTEDGSIGYVIEDDDVVFNAAKGKLDKEYKKAIDEFQELKKKMNEILAEEVELEDYDFHKVGFSDLPNELTANQIEGLEFMIVE